MKSESPYLRFLSALRTRLDESLPGQVAHYEMSPLGRQHPDLADIETMSCREAAVLALFYPNGSTDGQTVHPASLLLTVRPDGMPDHAGQVAFPGGRREEDETLEETALRETEEEVEIPRDSVDILGRLTPLFIPPSGFCVYPYVGAMRNKPDLSIVSDEVVSVFGVTVSDLTDSRVRRHTTRTIGEKEIEVPCFDLNGEFVWGATAMMMAELATVLAAIAC